MDFNSLKALGLVFDEKIENVFLDYIEYFKKYNSHTNLVSKSDEKVLFEKHIYDSLAFNLFIQKYKFPKNLMDIGTGGGFPSIPISLVWKNIDVFAVDSTAKKIKFINSVKENYKLENLKPVVSRIEELPIDLKESFDVVTTRALGALPMILEYAIPYLKSGGYFIAYKSKDSEEELKSSKSTLKTLNTKLVDTIEYKLPMLENFDRKLLIFQKKGAVLSIYPRPYSIMKKNPL